MRDKYEELQTLSVGLYGRMIMCWNRETGKLVVMNKMTKHRSDVGLTKKKKREFALLLSLDSPYVARVLGADVVRSGEKTEAIIVFEYVDNDLGSTFYKVLICGSLRHTLCTKFPWECRTITRTEFSARVHEH